MVEALSLRLIVAMISPLVMLTVKCHQNSGYQFRVAACSVEGMYRSVVMGCRAVVVHRTGSEALHASVVTRRYDRGAPRPPPETFLLRSALPAQEQNKNPGRAFACLAKRPSGKPLAFRRPQRYIPRLALPVTVGGAIEEQSP
jgi:hypothetical protein